VRLPEFIRSSTFRWTVTVAGAFAACVLLLFGFVYWQTAAYMTARIDATILQEIRVIGDDAPRQRLAAIDERLRQDPRRVRLGGLFDSDGQRLAGNIERVPAMLPADELVHDARLVRIDSAGREEQTVRATARRLPNGDVLVIGRNVDELRELAEIVRRVLVLGLLPALGLGIATGALLSLRSRKRVEEVNETVGRIVAGDLRQRLPTRGVDDPFDKLAVIVNGMLDRIEALVQEVAGVGDDIAHDLRTPLTRLRVRLERGIGNAKTIDELRQVVEQSVGELDQALAIITALLRIAEIEHSRRIAGFGDVALPDLIREVGDLYEPIAEDKQVELRVTAADQRIPPVRGDRDLIFEAVANLVDNAVKFTPAGGHVELALLRRDEATVVRVSDTGPGIGEEERDLVTRRFYRSDKSRHTDGLGLGLNLVSAIARLHGFRLNLNAGPGCIAELVCPPTLIGVPE
jgi:signal transduction histidine kinase